MEAVYSLSSSEAMDEGSRDELLSRLKDARDEVDNVYREEEAEYGGIIALGDGDKG